VHRRAGPGDQDRERAAGVVHGLAAQPDPEAEVPADGAQPIEGLDLQDVRVGGGEQLALRGPPHSGPVQAQLELAPHAPGVGVAVPVPWLDDPAQAPGLPGIAVPQRQRMRELRLEPLIGQGTGLAGEHRAHRPFNPPSLSRPLSAVRPRGPPADWPAPPGRPCWQADSAGRGRAGRPRLARPAGR